MITNLALPMTTKAYYSPAAAKANLRIMQDFQARNAAMLELVSQLTGVPTIITLGYMYVESECGHLDTRPKSKHGAVGLMQIDSETATDTLNRELDRKRLSDEEKTFIRKYIGATYDLIARTHPERGAISQAQLMQPAFNVYIATLYLGQLLDAHTENGVLRMDKVLVLYNRGVNSRPVGDNADAIMAFAKKKWRGFKGQVTSDYVVKLVGTNGLLHTLATASATT